MESVRRYWWVARGLLIRSAVCAVYLAGCHTHWFDWTQPESMRQPVPLWFGFIICPFIVVNALWWSHRRFKDYKPNDPFDFPSDEGIPFGWPGL